MGCSLFVLLTIICFRFTENLERWYTKFPLDIGFSLWLLSYSGGWWVCYGSWTNIDALLTTAYNWCMFLQFLSNVIFLFQNAIWDLTLPLAVMSLWVPSWPWWCVLDDFDHFEAYWLGILQQTLPLGLLWYFPHVSLGLETRGATEIKYHSLDIVWRVPTASVNFHAWCWTWPPGWGCVSRVLCCKAASSPQDCGLWKEAVCPEWEPTALPPGVVTS